MRPLGCVFLQYHCTPYSSLGGALRPFIFLLVIACQLFSSLSLASPVKLSDQTLKKAHFSFSHILPSDVEALGYLNAIAMDHQGFMWFGGSNGLARYDGYSLLHFRQNNTNAYSLAANMVNDIVVASDGTLWVATEAGLSRFDAKLNRFINYVAGSDEANAIRSLVISPDDQLWLGTGDGLWQFDAQNNRLKAVTLASNQGKAFARPVVNDLFLSGSQTLFIATQEQGLLKASLNPEAVTSTATAALIFKPAAGNDVRSVFLDSQHNLWAGTYQGILYKLGRTGKVLASFRQPEGIRSDVIWAITEGVKGQIWVGDGGGVNLLDENKQLLIRYSIEEGDPSSPGNFAARTLYEDHLGDLWIGYFPSGVDRLDRQASAFRNFKHSQYDDNSLTDGGVLSVAEDAKGNLWIGTGFGLNYFDRNTETFSHYFNNPENYNSLSGNTALSLALNKNTLWIGSWSQGLNHLNLEQQTFNHYRYNPDDATSLLGYEPWSLLKDNSGDLWIGTELGLNYLAKGTREFKPLQPKDALGQPSSLYIRDLLQDSQGVLWLATDRGLFRYQQSQFEAFIHDPNRPSSLSANYVKALFEDSENRLWVGTHGGGLNRLDRGTGRFVVAGEPSHHSLIISAITEDRLGQLWLATSTGLYRYSLSENQFTRFSKDNGLLSNVFNRNATITLRTGEIFAGSTGGFTLIEPDKITTNPTPPRTVITELTVFNKPVTPLADDGLLTEVINHTQKVTLESEHSVFTLNFAALSYQLPQNNQYAYFLEGFDNDWHFVGNQRTATYTNLDAGRYVFHVKAANSDGTWATDTTQLAIRVMPPLWQTWWAYALYIAAILALLALVAVIHMRKVALKNEQTLNQQLVKLDKVKDAFLASTSHELRTPLNGIIGIANNLLDTQGSKLPLEVRDQLAMISSSGQRLASLVNDILDYSKLSEQQLKVNTRKVSPCAIMENVEALLKPLASAKSLKLINHIDLNTPAVQADPNRLQQILINLVGNGIKYTHEGQVTISAKPKENQLRFLICDSGIGIPEAELSAVFDVFHQIDHTGEHHYAGTGLGLAITKQLVELQHGHIWVQSTPGEGSTFYFTLPLAGDAHNQTQTDTQADNPSPPLLPPCPLPNPNNKTILIVDDDSINRMVLAGVLKLHNYSLAEVTSGLEAIEYFAAGNQADMAIVDVMMPGMNGFTLCQKLREQFNDSELPIIFLSANITQEDKRKGSAAGGNHFLAKPVNKQQILSTVGDLLYRGHL